MANKNLTTKSILEKEFKTTLRGFNTDEVDEFLDLVIRDYDSYDAEIASLEAEIDSLKQQITELEKNGPKTPTPTNAPTTGVTNFDILKRISNLEKEVFGSKINNDSDGIHDDEEDVIRVP